MQFLPGVAILPGYAFYSKRGQSSSWAGGREAEHDGSRGFRMMEPPRASSGSARIPRSLAAGNCASLANGNWRRPPKAQERSRSPPGVAGGRTATSTPVRRWASGCHR